MLQISIKEAPRNDMRRLSSSMIHTNSSSLVFRNHKTILPPAVQRIKDALQVSDDTILVSYTRATNPVYRPTDNVFELFIIRFIDDETNSELFVRFNEYGRPVMVIGKDSNDPEWIVEELKRWGLWSETWNLPLFRFYSPQS